MPDVTADAELYDSDFFAWTRVQAKKLRHLQRARANVDLDLPHLVEEVADLGKAERNALRSEVRRIIEHCLKLEYSPAHDPRAGWRGSILDARAELADRITASLKRDLERKLPSLYGRAREKAENAPRDYQERATASLPADCPYRLEDLLADDWYPNNRHGLPNRSGCVDAMPDTEDRARLRGFRNHLLGYFAVMAVIVPVNLIFSPERPWFVWPMVGWGGVLAIHVAYVMGLFGGR